MSEERREGNIQMAADIGYMRGVLEGLAGPQGRITKLESAATRNWWMTYVVTPALFIGHAIARNMGARI